MSITARKPLTSFAGILTRNEAKVLESAVNKGRASSRARAKWLAQERTGAAAKFCGRLGRTEAQQLRGHIKKRRAELEKEFAQRAERFTLA